MFMAGLPKKYAKMGFKKGWAAYKKSKRSPARKATRTSRPRKVKNMARRRSYSRRRGGRKKTGIVGIARGGIYAAIPALTTYTDYNNLKDAGRSPGDAAQQAILSWAGISPSTKKFDTETLVGNWGPVAAWAAVDMVAGKFGVWRKMGRLLRF